jgi:hypothetical protein
MGLVAEKVKLVQLSEDERKDVRLIQRQRIDLGMRTRSSFTATGRSSFDVHEWGRAKELVG